jgi:hypothetical protein
MFSLTYPAVHGGGIAEGGTGQSSICQPDEKVGLGSEECAAPGSLQPCVHLDLLASMATAPTAFGQPVAQFTPGRPRAHATSVPCPAPGRF